MKIKKPLFWDKKSFSIWKYILFPLSLIYFLLSKINLKKKKIINNIFSICVGNIYIGGTGKTPTCILIKNILDDLNIKTSFVKKHYADQVDEQYLLGKHGSLYKEKSRENSIIKSRENGFQVAIVDDGLQDKTIDYNLKIVCFNSEIFIGNGHLIPSGPLRSKLSEIKNFDVIFLNGLNRNNEKNIYSLKEVNQNIPIFETIYKIKNIESLDKSYKYLIFAGIGNPNNFLNLLKFNNINVVKKIFYPDHYAYKLEDINKINNLALKENLKIITTEKDYLRLNEKMRKNINYIKIELSLKNKNDLINFLKNKI